VWAEVSSLLVKRKQKCVSKIVLSSRSVVGRNTSGYKSRLIRYPYHSGPEISTRHAPVQSAFTPNSRQKGGVWVAAVDIIMTDIRRRSSRRGKRAYSIGDLVEVYNHVSGCVES